MYIILAQTYIYIYIYIYTHTYIHIWKQTKISPVIPTSPFTAYVVTPRHRHNGAHQHIERSAHQHKRPYGWFCDACLLSTREFTRHNHVWLVSSADIVHLIIVLSHMFLRTYERLFGIFIHIWLWCFHKMFFSQVWALVGHCKSAHCAFQNIFLKCAGAVFTRLSVAYVHMHMCVCVCVFECVCVYFSIVHVLYICTVYIYIYIYIYMYIVQYENMKILRRQAHVRACMNLCTQVHVRACMNACRQAHVQH
jgi:hypothetical protein